MAELTPEDQASIAKISTEPAKGEVTGKLDGWSSGVRANAALRDVVLGQPICPKSQIRGKLVNGNYEPPEIGPNDMPCSLAGGDWWVMCADKGHEPYFTQGATYHTEDVTEIVDGVEYVVNTRKRIVRYKRLNATRVSPNVRHDSGTKVAKKVTYHGYKTLESLGFEPVCQFRGCQKPPTVRSQYGDYCDEAHMALVAANEQETFLPIPNGRTDVGAEKRIARERNQMLRESLPLRITEIG